MSDAEILLWSRLRKKHIKGHQFYRQRIIGNFIVDFYCPKGKLIVEPDGGQHYMEVNIIMKRKIGKIELGMII